MKFEQSQWYHIYNRGNNKQPIFFSEENYLYFLKKMRKQLLPHCNIVAYCLMPNHFHWLVRVKEIPQSIRQTASSGLTGVPGEQKHPLVQKIATLLNSYTQGINKQRNRSGSLFQQKTKAKLLTDSDYNYPLTCFHYIHQNPLRAGLIHKLGDWSYSSYRDYAGQRNGTLVSKSMAFAAFEIADTDDFTAQSSFAINPEKIKKLF